MRRLRHRLRARQEARRQAQSEPPKDVVVATFQDSGSAYVAAGSLEAAGIEAFVREVSRSIAYPSTSGPVQVLVRAEDEDAARRYLISPP